MSLNSVYANLWCCIIVSGAQECEYFTWPLLNVHLILHQNVLESACRMLTEAVKITTRQLKLFFTTCFHNLLCILVLLPSKKILPLMSCYRR